jgi:hypothetical protein
VGGIYFKATFDSLLGVHATAGLVVNVRRCIKDKAIGSRGSLTRAHFSIIDFPRPHMLLFHLVQP